MCFVCTAGNDQMKVENFAAAVEFYSKAIAMNPQNAVYYCNRSVGDSVVLKGLDELLGHMLCCVWTKRLFD